MPRWAKNEDEKFKQLWAEGMMVKNIMSELGRSKKAILWRRRFLKLQPRRCPPHVKRKSLTIYMDERMRMAVQRRAFGKYTSLSEYVRMLIRRDCGIPIDEVVPRKGDVTNA